jgi:hypothetical protein
MVSNVLVWQSRVTGDRDENLCMLVEPVNPSYTFEAAALAFVLSRHARHSSCILPSCNPLIVSVPSRASALPRLLLVDRGAHALQWGLHE